MESANLHHHHHHHQHHHHQLQEQQLILGSSSSSSSASLYGVGITNNSSWNPNLILNNAGNFNLSTTVNGVLSNSRDLRQNNNDINIHHQVPPSLSCSTTSMIDQDLGFHWGGRSFINDQSARHELNLAKVKKELIISSSDQYSHHDDQSEGTYNLDDIHQLAASPRNYFKHEEVKDLHDLSSSTTTDDENNKLFLRIFSSGDHNLYCNNPQQYSSSAGFADQHPSSRENHNRYFSQIFPSRNISSPNPSSFSSSTHPILDLNSYRSLDILSSATKIIGGSSSSTNNNIGQPASISQSNNLGRRRQLMRDESSLSFDHHHHHHLDHHDHLQTSSSSLSWPNIINNHPSKMISSGCLMNLGAISSREVATKRSLSSSGSNSSSGGLATKASSQTAAPKKPRLESSRSSFPPIKVRKEKLGDRIANLQQLVAPFGKTDTASVLMEAIGYIKFLHEQVETLSVPYMKSSVRNNIRPNIQRGSIAGEGEIDEPKRDLRSRGLCLVPLSCTSYITNDVVDVGVNWSSPQYYGGARP
ncbi:Myc-type [Macleaya cordata]|uniref:Myc-type n=1 Tax=Macleaya cordata TaxID=56857 RepID=A0A200QE29_MACCD|nr:Myc-type [Macleaya cordata]